MKKAITIVALACFAGSAFAAEVMWLGNGGGGGDGTTWEDNNNWVDPTFATVVNMPTSTDNAKIMATSWQGSYPTLSSAQTVSGLYMGLNGGEPAEVATLSITAAGSLTTDGTDGWNDGLQLGWGNDTVLTSAGAVNTIANGTGVTDLGAGGSGNATVNIIGGTWLTGGVTFQSTSVNHVQLDAGTLTTWGLANLHMAGQTLDITDGTLVFYTGDTGWFDWMKVNDLGLTGYGSAANVVGSYAGGGWTVTAIPEPATLSMVAMLGGGLVWIRKRFTI